MKTMVQFTHRRCNLPRDFDYKKRHIRAVTGSFEDQNLDLKKNRVGDTFLIAFDDGVDRFLASARIVAIEASHRLDRKYTDLFYSDFRLLDSEWPERTPGPGTTRYVDYELEEQECA